jgi:dihydrofolate reductase
VPAPQRLLFSFLIVSADGYDQLPNGEFEWFVDDDEFRDFSVEQLDEVDLLLFGRRTYDLMASYWPTPEGIEHDPAVAERINRLPKFVASRTITSAEWANTAVLEDPLETAVERLKQQPGETIGVLGSAELTTALIDHGLLDELRLLVSPVLLGAGRSVLRTLADRVDLELLRTRVFASGNVLLTYHPRPS